ncbi:MAG: DUF308 domain-containing protein [Eubacterium sp.]|jgi:uncharacterized membrane protein HdeD (DUF308 family)|nr:DUF308 domain-containing protein [Eubacterium sp.]
MKELFKKLRIAAYVSAILTIALGGILIAWPMEVTGLICRVLGALLVVMGAVYIFGYIMEGRGILTVAGGLLFLLLGVWIFITPGSIATLVPIVIGVVLLVHSLRDFQMAADAKQHGSSRFMMLFLLALLNCVFGVICICDSFGVLSVAVRMLGIALVYDGISNMIIIFHTVQAVRYAAEKIAPIDVEAHEVDEL